MKKTFILLAAALFSAVSVNAQTLSAATVSIKYCFTTTSNQSKTIWASQVPYVWNGATFTAADFETANPSVKESTGLQNARGCDSIVTMTVTMQQKPARPKTGAAWGLFSVSSTQQVYFAQGNLQYQPSTQTFRFAENQYDFVGGNYSGVNYGNVYEMIGGTNTQCDNANISNSSYQGWLDLITWNTAHPSVGMAKYDNNNERTYYDNIGSNFVDWGTKTISNGGNSGNTTMWYTPSQDNWQYLISYRTNASSKWGYATLYSDANKTNAVACGLILLPDTWSQPSGVADLVNGYLNTQLYERNKYSVAEWELMELAGAVFLPVAGMRDITTVSSISGTNPNGFYWSSYRSSLYHTSYLYINANQSASTGSGYHHYGCSVRLVQNK